MAPRARGRQGQRDFCGSLLDWGHREGPCMWSPGDNVEGKARDPRNRRVGGGRLGGEVKSNSSGGFEAVGSFSGASENLRDGGVVGG